MMPAGRLTRCILFAVGFWLGSAAWAVMAQQADAKPANKQTIQTTQSADADAKAFAPLFQNAELDFGMVVIFGFNSVALEENVQVLSGEVVVNEASPGPTLQDDVELSLGNNVDTSDNFPVRANRVKMKPNTVIGADLYANEVSKKGRVNGDVFPLTLPVFTWLPPFQNAPPETDPLQDLTVGQNEFLTLVPGTYGDLEIKNKGALLLTGGVYNFRNIETGNNASLLFSAGSQVRVSGRLSTGNNGYIGPDSGVALAASEILFYIAGLNGGEGGLGGTPVAAEIGVNNEIFANFFVPNGTLHFRQNGVATGAFLGNDVLVENNTELALDSGFFNRAPVAVDDSFTLNRGATATALDSGETSLLANDSDFEGDPLTVTTTPVVPPSHGTLVLEDNGEFRYTHNGDSAESDSFVYEVCDDGQPVGCSLATVSIVINQVGLVVRVSKSGAGDGVVRSSPEGLDCGDVCIASFSGFTVIFLTADADDDSVFTGWSGDADCSDGILLPPGDKNCVANFDLKPPPPPMITVTVARSGSGDGEVTSRPSGIDCGTDCSAMFPQFSPIRLEAEPDANSIFVGWAGDDDCGDGLLDGSVDADCIALFEQVIQPPATYELQVQRTGDGFVGSTPSGIICGIGCTADFEQNASVRLSARPDPGWSFAGWGGDCSGTAFFTEVVMDGDKVCTALFVQQ